MSALQTVTSATPSSRTRSEPWEALCRGAGAAAGALSSLVVPRTCPCGEEDTWLCTDCRELLMAPPQRVETACDALLLLADARVRPRGNDPAGVDLAPLMPVLALGQYTGALQRIILAWKNGGALHLAGPIAAGVAPAITQLTARQPGDERLGEEPSRHDPVWLVPVPSTLSARLRRGEAHTAHLTRRLERADAGRTMRLRARPSSGQDGHDARERRRRRIAIGTLPAQARGGRAVIVDDVVTTGSTLRAMHDALTEAGVQVVGAVVVAAARIPGPSVHDMLSSPWQD